MQLTKLAGCRYRLILGLIWPVSQTAWRWHPMRHAGHHDQPDSVKQANYTSGLQQRVALVSAAELFKLFLLDTLVLAQPGEPQVPSRNRATIPRLRLHLINLQALPVDP